MRRTTTVTLAALLALSSAPALAQEAEESAGPGTDLTQRVEAPQVGLSIAFPEGWRVSQPEGTRESALTTAEGEPILETTAVYANGRDAGLCDVDVYLDTDAPLEQHAFAYVRFLEQTFGGVPMVVSETELPAGPAYRIEMVDAERQRIRSLFLFDGLAAEDGSTDRFLLSCATPPDAEPIGQAVAESLALYAPVEAEASAAPAEAPAE